MKFIKLTTEQGRSISVNPESIALATPSNHEHRAQTAIYEMIETFVEDGNSQENALHVRESIGYINEMIACRVSNEKR
jgi:hypothetical protein